MAEDATNKIKSLKQELREATTNARAFAYELAQINDKQVLTDADLKRIDELNKGLVESTESAAKLRDAFNDANEQIAVLSAGSPFEKISNNLGDIGGKLASLDFGGANESAQRLVKLTQTITFKDAISGVKDLGSTFLNLGKALLTNPMFLIAAAIAAAVAAVVKLLDKMGLLKKIGEAIGWVFEKIGEFIDWIVEGVSTVVDALFGTTLVAEQQAQKLAEQQDKLLEKTKARSEAVVEASEREIKEQKALGKNTDELERRKLEQIIKTAQVEFDLYNERVNNRIYLNGLDEEEIKNLKEKFKESKKALLDAKSDIKVFNNTQQKEAEDNRQNEAEKDKQAAEKAAQRRRQYAADRLVAQRQFRDLELANMEEGIEKELAQTSEKYKRLIEDTKRNEKLTADERKKIVNELTVQQTNSEQKIIEDNNKKKLELEQAYQDALKELSTIQAETRREQIEQDFAIREAQLRKEYTDEVKQAELLKALEIQKQAELSKIEQDEFLRNNEALLQLETTGIDQKKAILEQQRQAELANKELTNAEKLLIDQQYAQEVERLDQEELERKQAVETAKLNIAKSGFDLITDVANLFAGNSEKAAKRAFDINKAVGIAQTTIATYQAAQAAYASQMTIPSPDAPVRAAIAAGIAVASGVAKVAAIAKTQFRGTSAPSAAAGGSTSGGSSGSGSTAQPAVNLFGQNNNQNTVSASSGQAIQNNVNVQSTVSVTEITQKQNKIAVIEERSSL